MFFEESQESGEDDTEFDTELEATPKIPENDFGLGEDGADDLFAEDDFEEVSEDADADSLFDEISSSVSLAEDAEETEDELLFQDIDDEEDEDLFGPVSVESSDLIEETPVFAETEAETEQAGSDDIELEAIDPELLECFREETEEHLANIDSCLNSLSARITDSVDLTPETQKTLHSLRRSVHTLKGAAAVIGIEQIAAWGHDFEDFLDWLHDEAQRLDPPAVAALRDGADLLASLAEEPTRPVEEEKQRITAKFADITAAFSLNFSTDSGTGTDNESEEAEEADSFFDELPLSVAAENNDADADDGFLFQDAEETEEAAEEDDFFGSVVSSGLPASSEDSENPDDSFDPFAAEISETGRGGPATEAETEAAEAIDPELLECFHEETEEHLENIDDCLNRLAVSITGPVEFTSTTRETLHSLRRSVHTLKGAAAVIGIEQIAAWGHDFEDFLDWLHDEARAVSPSLIALLREGADLLAELAEEPALSVEARKADLVLHFKEIIAGDQKKEKVASSEDQEGEEGADSFFDEVPIAASDDQRDDFSENSADNAFDAALDAAPETAGSGALELGEDIDAELLQCFHEEAEEHLDNIDRQLNHLGMTVSDETELTDLKRDSLHSIRRSVHTLKGAAAVIGIEQIAAWGHDFEDFLDWLHDEARIIRPEVVKAMQEGTDILVRLVEDPKRSLIADRQKIRKKFAHITIDDIGKSSLVTSSVEQETAAPARQRQERKTATLRVDINRIDQMVGLSGDMVINLSSFEDSMDATAGTMKELDMILQRLKNINSSLEAGYE
ncbi:MAG: hypothetical protein D3914_10685, partial [Candidatus Electrothrix sp. LOE2]|nr:hypothetical protein [Candidatus Electrothrix sp. LOE2]